jgi:hypothetical protein
MRHTPAALANLLFTMSGRETQTDMKEACLNMKIANSLAWTIASGALSICNTCQSNTPPREQAANRDITQGSKCADDIAADPPLMSDVVPIVACAVNLLPQDGVPAASATADVIAGLRTCIQCSVSSS